MRVAASYSDFSKACGTIVKVVLNTFMQEPDPSLEDVVVCLYQPYLLLLAWMIATCELLKGNPGKRVPIVPLNLN